MGDAGDTARCPGSEPSNSSEQSGNCGIPKMRIRTNFLQKQRTTARQLGHLFAVGPKQTGGLEVGSRPLGGVGGYRNS
jgi:hypothetical protein